MTIVQLIILLIGLSGQQRHADGNSSWTLSPAAPDYWAGKYVRLPAGDPTSPVKLAYVTIKKEGSWYEVDCLPGQKLQSSLFNRVLSEVSTSSTWRPTVSLRLNTATL